MTYTGTATDAAAEHGEIVACSGLTAATTQASSEIDDGGTAGSSEDTITLPGATATVYRSYYFESISGEPNEANWGAGDWTVAFECTASHMSIELDEIYVCRVDSGGGSPVTIGSETGLGISMATTGIKSHTLTGLGADSGAASDRIYIVLGFTNSAHGSASLGITPSQDIVAPIGAAFVDFTASITPGATVPPATLTPLALLDPDQINAGATVTGELQVTIDFDPDLVSAGATVTANLTPFAFLDPDLVGAGATVTAGLSPFSNLSEGDDAVAAGATVTGELQVTVDFDPDQVNAGATITGELEVFTPIDLTALITPGATVTANLTPYAFLSAGITPGATVTAELQVTIDFDPNTVSAGATTSAELTPTLDFDPNTVSAGATVTANLTPYAFLSASITPGATVTGTLVAFAFLDASIAPGATVTANLTPLAFLLSSIAPGATITAELDVFGAAPPGALFGTAFGVATVTATPVPPRRRLLIIRRSRP